MTATQARALVQPALELDPAREAAAAAELEQRARPAEGALGVLGEAEGSFRSIRRPVLISRRCQGGAKGSSLANGSRCPRRTSEKLCRM